MLRVLNFEGPAASSQRTQVAAFVPHLTVDEIADLIREPAATQCLLGLFAARELRLAILLPLVHQRTDDTDELIAQIANEVETALLDAPLQHAQQVASNLRVERDAPFALLGDAQLRRQLLRQTPSLDAASRPGVEWLLRSGLHDADPEVRATAMLLCARLALDSERETIRRLSFTTREQEGFSPIALEHLRHLQEVVSTLLVDRPQAFARDPHAVRCLEGKSDGVFDALFVLVHTLTTPLSLAGAPTLPAHVVRTATGYALARTKLALCYVAPVPCWLGAPDGGVHSPLRRTVPQAGFFIFETALKTSALLAAFARAGERDLASSWQPTSHSEPDGDLALSHSDALILTAALSRVEGAPIVLPGPDQWELAARGSDARRYPWGNLLEPNPQRRLSPWAVAGMTGGQAEWTQSTDGAPIACGGPTWTCFERRGATPTERLALRPVTR